MAHKSIYKIGCSGSGWGIWNTETDRSQGSPRFVFVSNRNLPAYHGFGLLSFLSPANSITEDISSY